MLYIPTRGRIERQSTWDELPVWIKKETLLACPASEAAEHQARGRNVLVCPVEGIIRKRQWILDYAYDRKQEYIGMMDDDLIFLRRAQPDAWNLTRCTPLDVGELLGLIRTYNHRYPQVGVSPRAGNNRFFPDATVTCGRVTNIHGYHVPTMHRLGVRFHDTLFPDTFTMEDFHVTLSLLRAGFPNLIITNFAWDQQSSNAGGGCSLYRNADTQRESAELLARRHPGLVRVVTKATKGGWSGVATDGVRHDVVISWKKAYQEGTQRKAA